MIKNINNSIAKHYQLIFIIFLFIQPLLDIITSICINVLNLELTLGIIIRIIFLGYVIYSGLFIYKTNLKRKLIYLILIIIFTLIYTINILTLKDTSVLFYEIQNLIKVLYFPLILVFINNFKIKEKYLINIFCIYSMCILIPTIFNLNFDAYTQGKVGSSGLFNSANEISAILTILLPFIISYTFNKDIKNKWLLIALIPLFMIGSKITIAALIFALIIIAISKIITVKINPKLALISTTSLIAAITLMIILIPQTSFYKNIIIHAEFLNINEVGDLFSYNSINRFIFSDRLDFLTNTHDNYTKAQFQEKLFGIGYVNNYATDNTTLKLVEMDVFDIFYRLGIIGFIITFLPIINYIKKIKNTTIENKISLFLIIILAFLVGHTLVAPAVSIFVVVILNNSRGDIKNDELCNR